MAEKKAMFNGGIFRDALWQDLRYTVRQLLSARGFAVVVIATLALGIGANTAIFTLLNAWLLRPLPLKDPQQLVEVWRTQLRAPAEPAYFDLYRDYLVWSTRNTSLQSLAATFEQSYSLTGAGEPRRLQGAVATWNLFSTVGASAEIGRLFVADDVTAEPSCIISHSLWMRQFDSSPAVLGRSIVLNGKLFRVIGVLPATFSLRVLDRPFDTDVWTLITAGDANYSVTSPAAVAVLGRLRPGITAAQAQANLSSIQHELDEQSRDAVQDSGVLVADLQADNTRTIRSSLLLLSGVVALLLVIACVNAGSLILGRNAQRAREFAVRVALGCGRLRLLQQLTTEVLVLFTAGGIGGVLMAWIFVRVFVVWSPFDVLPPGGISLDSTVFTMCACVVGVTALIFGSIPALRALRFTDGGALREGLASTAGPAQIRSRMIFVGAEIALSVILLVSAGLLISTFIKIGAEPLGFRTSDVFVTDVALPYSAYNTVIKQTRFGEELSRNMRQIPGIQAAAVALSWPFNVNGLSPIEIEGAPQSTVSHLPRAATFTVGQGYFESLGITLFRGRTFSDEDQLDSLRVAVINNELALEYFAGQDPIGKQIRSRLDDDKQPAGPWLTVVGIVGDTRSVRYNQIRWDRYPAIYTPLTQRPEPPGKVHNSGALTLYMYFQTRTPVNISAISSAAHDLDPNLPVSTIRSTGEIVRGLRSQPRTRAALLGSFAILTLLLAAIGVYGVMTQLTESRRRDLGIRIALGARPSDIRGLVFRRATALTLPGVAIGVLGAIGVARLLGSFLYGISALNPAIFAGVVVVLCGISLLASYKPARRAGRVDPINALRSE